MAWLPFRLIISTVGKRSGNLTFSCTFGGNINWWNLFEQPFGSMYNFYSLTQPSYFSQCIPQEHSHKSTGQVQRDRGCASEHWKPPSRLSIGDRLNNSCASHKWNPPVSLSVSNKYWHPNAIILSHPDHCMVGRGWTIHSAAPAQRQAT